MKKRIYASINVYLLVLIPLVAITFAACKKKSSDPSITTTPITPAQTLNKSTLTPKKWYNQGTTIIHYFKANGVYGVDGEWKWIGNSDTMEIKESSASVDFVKWKFYYNTDHEMKCRWINNSQDILFKDAAW